MRIEDLLKLINRILPPETAMEGDRTGLQIQSGLKEVHNLLVTLELTDEVLNEALEKGSDCIIAFHPLIYRPLAEINHNERVGRLTTELIKNSISLISVHTAFDAHHKGTNSILSKKLGLEKEGWLVPDKNSENTGMGIIGSLEERISLEGFLNMVSEAMHAPLKYCTGKSDYIKRVAVVGGSGSSFLDDALNAGADIFITGDISYHTFHAMKGRMALVDPGHYEMEQFNARGIAQLIYDNIDDDQLDKIDLSTVRTNPVSYFFDEKNYNSLQENYLSNINLEWCEFYGISKS